jgi:hypothetical protein
MLEAQYERTVVKQNAKEQFHILSRMNTVTQSGEWLLFGRNKTEPEQIVAVYKKNNILFINRDMYMFNNPGFCWDGQNEKGKLRSCIEEILPQLTVRNLSFDSVYVYRKRFYSSNDSISYRYYISVNYPLILKQEQLDENSKVVLKEELVHLKFK